MKVSFDGANYNIYINKKYITKLTICFIFKKKLKLAIIETADRSKELEL